MNFGLTSPSLKTKGRAVMVKTPFHTNLRTGFSRRNVTPLMIVVKIAVDKNKRC